MRASFTRRQIEDMLKFFRGDLTVLADLTRSAKDHFLKKSRDYRDEGRLLVYIGNNCEKVVIGSYDLPKISEVIETEHLKSHLGIRAIFTHVSLHYVAIKRKEITEYI